jgi:hypothetical protein
MSKFSVFAIALAVASLGSPTAGKAEEPIKFDLPITSIGGFAAASVGFLSSVIDSKNIDTPGQSLVLETDNDAQAIGSVLILPSPTPSIKLEERAEIDDFGVANVGIGPVQLQYSMVIIGPSGSVPVKISALGIEEVDLDQRSAVNSSPVLLGTAMSITDAGAITFRVDSQLNADVNSPKKVAGFNYNDTISLDTLTIFTVTLTAQVDDVYLQGSPENIDYTAVVDPQFIIGGDDPSAYSLEFSAGVGNGPISGGVPEPSTWAMMMLGFAGLGCIGWRGSRKAAAQTA